MSKSPMATLFLSLSLLVPLACGDDGAGDGETSSGEVGAEASSSESGDGDGDGDGDEGTTGDPNCGNGMIDGDEVCDDGNNVTEFPGSDGNYAPTDCMDDCSMLLADCGNGVVDPGEDCDDGNMDSMDACTTSCTVNTMGVHSACTRSTGSSDQNVTTGEISNCDNVPAPDNMEVGCVLSSNFFNQTFVFAAEGDCQMMAAECNGASCDIAGFQDVGDYAGVTGCPEGHVLVDKMIAASGLIPEINSKVCQRSCVSDRECRWNARDTYMNDGWTNAGGTPYGQFRCQVTPDSQGMRICTDGRNEGL